MKWTKPVITKVDPTPAMHAANAARVIELEVALEDIAKELRFAHDGACIGAVRRIVERALAK